MYKNKYYKYKNKYLHLMQGTMKGGGLDDDPDIVDYYDEDDLILAPHELFDSIQEDEEDANNILNDMMLKKEDFEGFETNKSDYVTDDLDQEGPQSDSPNEEFSDDQDMFIGQLDNRQDQLKTYQTKVTFTEPEVTSDEPTLIDIGEFGEVRGKAYDIGEFDEKSLFTNIQKKINKNKILLLKDKDSFDTFTDKYAKPRNNKIFINWLKVAKDYKGICIASSVLGDREDEIPFNNRITVDNWLYYDYNRLDDVIIFYKPRSLINFKEINRPFKGKMVDPYAIPENEFARLADPITFDKIVVIDDVTSFDKFTNKYGFLSKNDISINWIKLNQDYDGFYIDKDNDFFRQRQKKAYYKGNKYDSWIKKYKIDSGVVYLFD